MAGKTIKPTVHVEVDSEYPHAFDGIQNWRDVGATINGFMGRRVLREGYLFRSGRLDEATAGDKERFRKEYGVKTILDLRTDTERKIRFQRNPATYDNNDSQQQSAKTAATIMGVETIRVYIINRTLEKALVWMLGWWSFFKFIALMLFGFRVSAIKIISKEVIQDIGLVGMGTMALKHSGGEIKKMFEILTPAKPESESPYPVVIHCTQGKDRTGLVILLILLCLQTDPDSSGNSNISLDAISHDYALTQAGLQRFRTEMVDEMVRDAGIPPAFVDVDYGFVEGVVGFLEERWGGLDGYLASLGLDPGEVRGGLRGVLLV